MIAESDFWSVLIVSCFLSTILAKSLSLVCFGFEESVAMGPFFLGDLLSFCLSEATIGVEGSGEGRDVPDDAELEFEFELVVALRSPWVEAMEGARLSDLFRSLVSFELLLLRPYKVRRFGVLILTRRLSSVLDLPRNDS